MIKHYTSMKEIARDMRTIKRVTRPLANIAQVTAALDDDKHIDIRGGKANIPSATPTITQKLSKELVKNTADLDKLMQHQKEVNNILNQLQNEFGNEDYPELEKMIGIAKRLIENLGTKIQTLKNQSLKTTMTTMPPSLLKTANILKKNLDKEMIPISEKASSSALTSMVNDTPWHTIYYVYTNVKDDAGEITPKVVFALSFYQGHHYINPSLHDTVVPNKFKLGLSLTRGKTPNDMAKIALQEINHQLTADSMLSAVTGSPVPFTKGKLATLKQEPGVTMDFSADSDALIVKISKKNETQVNDIAEKLTIQLNSMILADKDLPKMRIRYTKVKVGTNWVVTFKFIPNGKYTGKTLNQEDVDHLRKRFSEDEVHQMLLSLKK